MDRAGLADWIERYERAWRSPGVEALATLFAPDATYLTAPFEERHRGLAAIEEMWEAEREGHDEAFEMESDPVAVEGDTGVARVGVRYLYPGGRTYRDIWIITLGGDGLCTAFEEWPFWPRETGGGFHSPGGGLSEPPA